MKRQRAHSGREMRIGLMVMMLLLASCGESHETAGPSVTPPTTPQGVVAEATSCSEIAITWSASTASGSADIEAYRVFRDGALMATVDAPSTAMSDSGLDESTTYGYQVSAVDTAGNESDRSAEVRATTPACTDPPDPCTPLSLYALPSPPSYVYDGWRPRAEQEALWNELWDAHELSDRVRAIGQSEQGRDIWLFECGQPTADVIVMDAQMHGNEDHPFEVMLMLADWLLGSCEPEALHILEHNRVMFIPSVNPDQANQDDGNTFTRWNSNHVNLNRNFVHNWSSAGSSDPSADDYRGPSPASESETQAMRWAFENYLPRVYVNFHTGAFRASGSGNGDLGTAILSNAPEFDGFFSASAGSGSGGAGLAVADAADLSPGVSAWLIEFFGSSSSSPYGNAWRHEASHLDELVSDYYPVIEEFFIAAAAEIE